MKAVPQIQIEHRAPFQHHLHLIFWLFFLLSFSLFTAEAQSVHPGREAISPQDLAKLTAPAVSGLTATGLDAADQVCPRFASGSATSAPPDLESQNGVLEVTLKFLTATDAQGLIRYCYIPVTIQ